MTDTHKDDKQLVSRLLAGDEHAYNCFFQEYFPRVTRFIARRLPANEIDDIAMNVMSQVFRRIETYRGEASLYTWICQVARSEVSSFYRKNDRSIQLVGTEDDSQARTQTNSATIEAGTEPHNVLERDRLSDQLSVALDELPEHYGAVLEAKYIEGLSMKEIARRLSMTPKAVESNLSRARKALKARLEHLSSAGRSVVSMLPGEQS